MRGRRDPQPSLFHALDVEARIRPDHPLRPLKAAVDRILAGLSDRFDAAYSTTSRLGVPPERLVKALLLMALYSVRSERQLVERIDTDLLFRWFLDVSLDEPAFDVTAFAHNRPRLEAHGLTAAFFQAVLGEALAAGPCSEHFSVDGTLIESYASIKTVRPLEESDGRAGPPAPAGGPPADGNGFKPRNPDIDFRGDKRTNDIQRSATDPEARPCRKGPGQETKLRHLGHALGENRHGLIVGVTVTEANGTAEREAAVDQVDGFRDLTGWNPATVGLDKGYDAGALFLHLEQRGVEPHGALTKAPKAEAAARPKGRDQVAARHRMAARATGVGYRLSQKCRKKRSAGSKRLPAWPEVGSSGGGGSSNCGRSGRPPTTWSGCGSCWPPVDPSGPPGRPPAIRVSGESRPFNRDLGRHGWQTDPVCSTRLEDRVVPTGGMIPRPNRIAYSCNER